MFYEDEKDILKEMMDQVPNHIDKRENSSLVYNALAPTAMPISKLRSDMDRYLSYGLVTSYDIPEEYLDLAAKPDGVFRKQASACVKVGVFKNSNGDLMDIPLNSRFKINSYIYKATEKISIGNYKMTCETIGTEGNYQSGNLLTIEYIENLGTAVLTDTLIEGTEKEDNESLYNRWRLKTQAPGSSGNKYDYEYWALQITNVGYAKCFPLWNGRGTVKVAIANTNKRAVTESLITEVFNHIEEERPTCANLTVVSAKEKIINVNAQVILSTGADLVTVKEKFKELLDAYFKSIPFNSKNTTSYVSIAKIGSILFSIDGIVDYSTLTVNNSDTNIVLDGEDIAILGTVTVS